MCRRGNCCLPLCCISRRKHQSFSINDTENKTKANKINPKQIESVRIISSTNQQETKPELKETKKPEKDDKKIEPKAPVPKQTVKAVPTVKYNKSVSSETSLSKFFHQSKQLKSSSPVKANDLSDDSNDKTGSNTISSWSSLTITDAQQRTIRAKQRTSIQTYDLTPKNDQTKKTPNNVKYTEKSKLALESIRRRLKEQKIQQQNNKK